MKSTLPLILVVIVLTGIAVGVEGPYDLEAQACRLVDLLAKGDYETAVKDFDPTMTLALPPAKLEEAWKSLQNAVGAFQKRQETHLARIQQYNVVFVTCKFDKALVDVKVVFDSDRKIAGLFFVPPESAGADYQMPSYARPDATREQSVTVVSGRWSLPGTLALPSSGAGPFPVAILVHGSGPHDRDETVGANRPFRDLAMGLAAKGIATLRYEKRTRQYPDSFAARTDQVTVRDETINDALAAAAMLRGRGDIDSKRIFIIGHSLGGMVAPRIAKDDPNIAGLVIMSAPQGRLRT